jgi:hypothetical protein
MITELTSATHTRVTEVTGKADGLVRPQRGSARAAGLACVGSRFARLRCARDAAAHRVAVAVIGGWGQVPDSQSAVRS